MVCQWLSTVKRKCKIIVCHILGGTWSLLLGLPGSIMLTSCMEFHCEWPKFWTGLWLMIVCWQCFPSHICSWKVDFEVIPQIFKFSKNIFLSFFIDHFMSFLLLVLHSTLYLSLCCSRISHCSKLVHITFCLWHDRQKNCTVYTDKYEKSLPSLQKSK